MDEISHSYNIRILMPQLSPVCWKRGPQSWAKLFARTCVIAPHRTLLRRELSKTRELRDIQLVAVRVVVESWSPLVRSTWLSELIRVVVFEYQLAIVA